MYRNMRIGISTAAHNEENFIKEVIDSMPPFVDRIYVTNDASTDRTGDILASIKDERLVVITHQQKMGVGAATISSHKRACEDKMDIIAVMAGDGQMPPASLSKLLDPIVEGRADYSKGNRLTTPQHRKVMPRFRLFGNFILTWLNKIASGYWHIGDPQAGYTAISREYLEKLNLDNIYKGWAFENDMLVKLNVLGARVVEVPYLTTYENRNSKIRYPYFIVSTSWVLLRDFLWRLWVKWLARFFTIFRKRSQDA